MPFFLGRAALRRGRGPEGRGLVPAHGALFPAPGEVFLVIGAADYEARVFVNGRFAGAHRGGYDEIRLNVTGLWDKER